MSWRFPSCLTKIPKEQKQYKYVHHKKLDL